MHTSTIIVVGHTQCGGARACLEAVQSASTLPAPDTPLTRWLAPLAQLITTLDLASAPTSTHLDAVVDANVELQVKNLCESDVIKTTWAAYANNKEEKKQVLVHGWVYDVATGRIKDLGITRGHLFDLMVRCADDE